MLIAPDAPELGVRHVHIGREILLQLPLRDVLAVERLDLRAKLLGRAGEVALPLGDVELAVGLERRVFGDLSQNLRGRRAARGLAQLLVRNPDAETAVLALEQDPLDQLVGDLVLDALLVLPAQPAAPLTPLLLQRALERRLELLQVDFPSVDLENDVSRPAQNLGHLAHDQPDDEGDREHVEDVFRAGAHAAHHTERRSPRWVEGP